PRKNHHKHTHLRPTTTREPNITNNTPTPMTKGKKPKGNSGQHTLTPDPHHYSPHQTKQTRKDQSRKLPKTQCPQLR
ncbi:Hypothetical predicted protein, partial [Pelobates cultripes]